MNPQITPNTGLIIGSKQSFLPPRIVTPGDKPTQHLNAIETYARFTAVMDSRIPNSSPLILYPSIRLWLLSLGSS